MAKQLSRCTPPRAKDLEFVDRRDVLAEAFSQSWRLRERSDGMPQVHPIFDTIEVDVHTEGIERACGGDRGPFLHRPRAVVAAMEHGQQVAGQGRNHQRRRIGERSQFV